MFIYIYIYMNSGGSSRKGSACSAGDLGVIPGSGRVTGEGIPWNPTPYSCLENSMDGGSWWPTVHEVAKSWLRLSDSHFISRISKSLKCMHVYIYTSVKNLKNEGRPWQSSG